MLEDYGPSSIGAIYLAGSALLIGIAYILLIPPLGQKQQVLGRQEKYINTEPKKREKPQTINDVLEGGEEPTAEFIEEFTEAHNAPMVSDEELERQALLHIHAESKQ